MFLVDGDPLRFLGFISSSTDREISFLACLAGVISAVSAVLTSIIAIFVYLEARNIKKMEWFAKTAANWQDFNRLIIDQKAHDRWRRIITGNILWNELNQNDLMIIYYFLNILVFEFSARSRSLLERSYAVNSVTKNILYFKNIWPELRAHLLNDGWPKNFISSSDKIIKGGMNRS